MRTCYGFSTLLCAFALLLSPMPGLAAVDEPRQAMAQWLTQQLHNPVAASQIITFPNVAEPATCTITQARHESTGATSVLLRCPEHILPQLVLLNFRIELDNAQSVPSLFPIHASSRTAHPIVRAGATLSADWRTETLHAQLPVIALESGTAGDEIRVRISQTNRILRARILSAHTVTIVAGA